MGGEVAGVPRPPAVKAQDADGHVTVRAVRISDPIVVDGLLDDPVYEQVLAIDGFVQQLPDANRADRDLDFI